MRLRGRAGSDMARRLKKAPDVGFVDVLTVFYKRTIIQMGLFRNVISG